MIENLVTGWFTYKIIRISGQKDLCIDVHYAFSRFIQITGGQLVYCPALLDSLKNYKYKKITKWLIIH